MGGDEVVMVQFRGAEPSEIRRADGSQLLVEQVLEEWQHPRYREVPREQQKVTRAYRLIIGSLYAPNREGSIRQYGAEPSDQWHLRFSEEPGPPGGGSAR